MRSYGCSILRVTSLSIAVPYYVCSFSFLNDILACNSTNFFSVEILKYLLTSGYMYGSIGIWS